MPHRKKRFSYGLCAVCEAPVQYPGLCGYKCSSCGWVKMTEIAMLLKKSKKEKIRNKKYGAFLLISYFLPLIFFANSS